MSTQNFKSHARFDPLFHYFLAPLSLALMIATIIHLFHQPDIFVVQVELAVFALALFFTVYKARAYALRNQDRIIRLEEQTRLSCLMPTETDVIQALTMDQLIGLRFAPDAEAPALARRAVKERLDRKAIKAAIVTWRPDEHRI